MGVGRARLRGGPAPRRARPALGRLRRLPLVPRHGPRVVRGRRGRRGRQRRVRGGQGRPRGTTRRGRRVHGRDDGSHRAGRVADDLPAHPRRRPVLRGHLPTQGAADRAPGERRRGLGHAARARARVGGPRRAAAARAHRPALPHDAGRRRLRRPPPGGCARPTTRPAAGSAPHPSSRPRWCWSSCCATTRAPARPTRSRWSAAPAPRWLAVACTTSWAAVSPGTPSTPTGSCRTSRRCSTTTPCSCGSTSTCGARRATPWLAAWPRRPPSSSCATCAPTRAVSRAPSTPTPSSTGTPTRG